MSAKASIKLFVPNTPSDDNKLFKWIAILTGSKNTLKGAGFFLGGLLLSLYGFQGALYCLSGGLFIVLLLTLFLLPSDLGKTKTKAQFSQLFANDPAINWLSAARFFLFGSRDVWFVVALPVYLAATLGWDVEYIGSFLALWIIGYGIVQALAPKLIKGKTPDGRSAQFLACSLMLIPATIAVALYFGLPASQVIIIGLGLFAVMFALNSAVHSYLIVAWSDHDKVAMNVGFYYMANAGGRLTGTVLSGLLFQYYGLTGCLLASTIFIATAAGLSLLLPRNYHG
jgi:predicted MFS family arabinose efflux permease